jgi:hypothetical protein
MGGMCGPCGGPMQPCCNGMCTDPSTVCSMSGGPGGMCQQCGGRGQPCCANNTCNADAGGACMMGQCPGG